MFFKKIAEYLGLTKGEKFGFSPVGGDKIFFAALITAIFAASRRIRFILGLVTFIFSLMAIVETVMCKYGCECKKK